MKRWQFEPFGLDNLALAEAEAPSPGPGEVLVDVRAVHARSVGAAELDERERMLLLTQQNVVLQLNHLRTHPSVAAALAKKKLVLHGWVYDIKDGAVTAYDAETERFLPVAERYAVELAARVAGEGHGCAA